MKKPKHLSKYGRLRAEVARLKNQRLQDAMCELANRFAGEENLIEQTYRSAMEELARLAGELLAERIEKNSSAGAGSSVRSGDEDRPN